MEIKERLESSLAIFENDEIFDSQLAKTVQKFKKIYQISDLSIFYSMIKSMSMCLIYDYFISVFNPSKDQIKLLGEWHIKKSNIIHKINEEKSILTMQGKIKDLNKIQHIHIISSKIANQQIVKIEENVKQDWLFKRLNFIMNGVNVSSKCYHLSLNRVPKNIQKCQKEQNPHQNRHTLNINESVKFKQIFLSLNQLNDSQKLQKPKLPTINSHQQKIQNMISKVRQTINKESKKFDNFEQKRQQQPRQKKKSINLEIQQQTTYLMHNHIRSNNKKQSSASHSKRKASGRLKRVGTLQNERTKSKMFVLNQFPILNLINSSCDSSFQSIPDTKQNWYQTEKKVRAKRVFTIHLPILNNKVR